MIRYDKLVRDKIPDIIRASGRHAEIRVASPDELRPYLFAKLHEELAELESAPSAEELADLLEVVHALARNLGLTPAQLESVREKKHRDRGGFDRHVVLIATD